MDVTAVSFDNPLGNTQTEATALDSRVVGRFAAKESVEDTREQSRRDTRAGVADLELCKTAVAAQFDAHQAIWLIVFDGVVSQIEQQLAQAMAVSLNEDLVAPSRISFALPIHHEAMGS